MTIYQDNKIFQLRLKWGRGLLVLAFLGLFFKLWHLTVLQSDYYQGMAERNRVRTVPMMAPRGLIYDREGRVLVDNLHSFNLVCYRSELSSLEKTLDFLVEGFGLQRENLGHRLAMTDTYSRYQPVVVKEHLTIQEVAYLLSRQSDHPELVIFREPQRSYLHAESAAHVLGYVGEISREQLSSAEFSGFNPGDIVGKYALERAYNQHLAGQSGYRKVLVNSLGQTVQELGRIPPVEGHELGLTLDLDLQWVAEKEIGARRGAVIAFDPRDGEVLVMVSQPAFNPNSFATRISKQEWNRLVSDSRYPLQNRVIQSTFAPGSIFKLVVALAGLETGVTDTKRSYYCGGGVQLYGNYFRCWKEGGHGQVSLREAIRSSCNVYFYLLGQKLGIDQISHFGDALGLGKRTGVDLLDEASGLVPSREWKERTHRQSWYAGETISVSIGQGPIHVTPIQLARAAGIIATGSSPPLRLVQHSSRKVLQTKAPKGYGFSRKNLIVLREAMWAVVNEWGTGRAAQVDGLDVCGKTGTAQTISKAGLSHLSEEEALRFTTNAWFVGFAPRESPEIVVVVLVESGGAGGSSAAPVAGKILQAFQNKYKARRKLEMAWGYPNSSG